LRQAGIGGIVLETGSKTCHAAILARSFNIPMVVGVEDACKKAQSGALIALDGDAGTVFVAENAGDKAVLERDFGAARVDSLDITIGAEAKLPAVSQDGRTFAVEANTGSCEGAGDCVKWGADGVGLFRTEFLFMGGMRLDDEEAQFAAYKKALDNLNADGAERPLTVRTCDIGGDKLVPGSGGWDEKNPLLGWRAIRWSLDNPDVFAAQLRAILRASAFGPVRILFPMISCPEEMSRSLSLLEAAKEELRVKKHGFDENISAGAMIEVPSAVMLAGELAELADFFSIGTNDLLQYTFAADRENTKVAPLACHESPAMLRMLQTVINAAHAAGKKCAMCGEMAGDVHITPLLAGLGLDAFSMDGPKIPQIKRALRSLNAEAAGSLAEIAVACKTVEEVRRLIEDWKL
jgi:phosphotransferase system enzyme I (PtsI)